MKKMKDVKTETEQSEQRAPAPASTPTPPLPPEVLKEIGDTLALQDRNSDEYEEWQRAERAAGRTYGTFIGAAAVERIRKILKDANIEVKP